MNKPNGRSKGAELKIKMRTDTASSAMLASQTRIGIDMINALVDIAYPSKDSLEPSSIAKATLRRAMALEQELAKVIKRSDRRYPRNGSWGSIIVAAIKNRAGRP